MDGQLSLFATKAKLSRQSEYEIHHCTNCNCIVPDRILIGNWRTQIAYKIRYCPNCGAEFTNSLGVNDIPDLQSKWYYEMHSFDGKH